ncbi:MAG: porin [Pseudomonadota bacterium]
MKNIIFSSALTTLLVSGNAYAIEVTGGYVDLGYSTFTDTDLGDKYNYNASGELAFSRMFSLQLDLGGYRFADLDESATNITLHTNLHTSGNASFGAFYGRDNVDGPDFQFYGVEAGFDAGPADIEGYLGRQDVTDFSGLDGTLFGISVISDLSDDWQIRASYDLVDNFTGALDFGLFSIGANYTIGDTAELYGNLGTAHISSPIVSGSSNEAYVNLGVRINFGSKRGTTFGRRGPLDKIPGLPG